MHQFLVTKQPKKPDEVVVEEPEVGPCKKFRCDDGNYRDLYMIAKAYATHRRADGDYDSSYDRSPRSEASWVESSSATMEVSGEVERAAVPEVTEEFSRFRALTDIDEQEEAVVAEEDNLPATFPDTSLLSVSKLTEALEQPSEANVDVTGDILEPGEL